MSDDDVACEDVLTLVLTYLLSRASPGEKG
jgi:hypothetical protein